MPQPDTQSLDPLLVGLADSLANAGSLEDLARPLLELLETVLGMESTYLTTVDEVAGLQHILFARNTSQLQIPEGESVPWRDTLCKRAIEQNYSSTDDVPGRWADATAARALGIVSYASMPVRSADGMLYGTLCAASTDTVALPANAEKVLEMFAHLISLHVQREQLVTQLQAANAQLATQALIDPLTGLPNRRALQMELARMLARRAREGQRLLVAFIDLDDFKAVNDQHGHDAGDALLVAIGVGLAETLRAGDLVARYGGDEFVVVAPADADAGTHNAAQLQQLLTARTQVQIPLDDGMLDDDRLDDRMLSYPGASVGVILTEPGDLDTDAVIARADAAMYLIKQARGGAR